MFVLCFYLVCTAMAGTWKTDVLVASMMVAHTLREM